MAIHIKTPEEIAGLRIAGRLASELLDYLTPFVKPGITTGELDKLAYDYTVNVQKCIPACLGYQPEGMTPYPATTCISINHVVCHGIPGEKKLKHGDIVNIDVTSIKDGFHDAVMGAGCVEKSRGVAEQLRIVAERQGVHFMDAAECEFNEVDFMHLTCKGHARLAELLTAAVPKLV